MRHQLVTLRGQEDLELWTYAVRDSDYPLYTQEQYETGSDTFAHVLDGCVMRYRKKIGESDDVEFVDVFRDFTFTVDGAVNVIAKSIEFVENVGDGVEGGQPEVDDDRKA